jgi:3-hydroxyisobutyrate dehydrogenase-like beta-hydroxyacid dehydrogenase
MEMPRIGFIGFGEAAYHISQGLKSDGVTHILAYDKFANEGPQGALVRQRAAETGVELQASLQQLVAKSDVIFSMVSANVAASIARESANFLGPGKIYADLNSAGPETKVLAAEIVAPTGALFVDGAVMGKVPGLGHKVPTLVSGQGAQALIEAMQPYGMNLSLVPGEAGKASLSKMLRSIFMKGLVALLLETVIAGRKYRLEDDLLESIQETMTAGPFMEVVHGLISRGVIHAERRAHEMDEVIATLDSMQVDSTMSRATRTKLQSFARMNFKDYFKGVPPEDFHEIFAMFEEPDR